MHAGPSTVRACVAVGSRRVRRAAMGAHGRYHLLSMSELTELCLALGCDPKDTATMSKLALVSALRTKLTLSRQQRSACARAEHGCHHPEIERSSPLPTPRSESPGSPRTTNGGRQRQARQGPQLHQQRTPRKAAGPHASTSQRRRSRPPAALTVDKLEEMEQRCRREMRVKQEHGQLVFHSEAGLTEHLWAGLHDTATTEEQLRQRVLIMATETSVACIFVSLASLPSTVVTIHMCAGDRLVQWRRAC